MSRYMGPRCLGADPSRVSFLCGAEVVVEPRCLGAEVVLGPKCPVTKILSWVFILHIYTVLITCNYYLHVHYEDNATYRSLSQKAFKN